MSIYVTSRLRALKRSKTSRVATGGCERSDVDATANGGVKKHERMIRNQARNRRAGTEQTQPGLDISSLIDVSFLLLIYFLITSTLDPKEGDLLLSMPGRPAPGAVADILEEPHIVVDAAGIVSMGGELLDSNPDFRELTQLRDRMEIISEACSVLGVDREFKVKVEFDDAVSGQRFIDVMNCLAGVGIKKIKLVDFDLE